jgi:hypothetical protein
VSALRETGTADRPRASRQVEQTPYDFWPAGVTTIYAALVQPPERIPDSDTQGEGKSPGHRWPWNIHFQGLAQSVYRNYRAHFPHELPTRILIQGERGPLDRHYLDYYEQAPRHAWPGGGVIEYPASSPVVPYARRVGEPTGVAL